jgi:PQQ-dependent catabolism-associated CXXCW motif protein
VIAIRVLLGTVLLWSALPGGVVAADEGAVEPEHYRTDNYRAPTPATLRGARVIDTAEAEAIWKTRAAVFVDVLPRPPRPPNLPGGTIWRDKPHHNISGSVWLPDAGYGALSPAAEQYFVAGLERATGGDRTKLVVVYCLKDCWMSWNAAKRALALGYSQVAWYPDGIDGWDMAGLPFQPAAPAPRPGD